MVGGRDVTVDIISAVYLLTECAAGVLSLEYPAARAAASPPSVRSPNVPGSTDGGLEGCGDMGTGGLRAGNFPLGSRRSPPVGGRPVGSRVEAPRPPQYSPPIGGKPPLVCWGCGAAGHLLRRCPLIRELCGASGRSPTAGRGGEPSPGSPGNVTGPPGAGGAGVVSTPHTPPARSWSGYGPRTVRGHMWIPGSRPHHDPEARAATALARRWNGGC